MNTCKACGEKYAPQSYEDEKPTGICQPCVRAYIEWKERLLKGKGDDSNKQSGGL